MIILDDFFNLEDILTTWRKIKTQILLAQNPIQTEIKIILESANEIFNARNFSNSLIKNCKDKLIFNLFLSHLQEPEQLLKLLIG